MALQLKSGCWRLKEMTSIFKNQAEDKEKKKEEKVFNHWSVSTTKDYACFKAKLDDKVIISFVFFVWRVI